MSERRLPGLDLDRFEAWLRRTRPDLLAEGTLEARLLTGGLSNLSYAVDGGREPWVLRRPPLGHVLSTAHDMAREFRVMSALAPTEVAVPRAHLFVTADEATGVGTDFYLMDLVPGRVLSQRRDNDNLSREHLASLGPLLASTLARLHDVDPRDVGLADFGRPEGFLVRQVARWMRQLDGSRSRELPALDRLAERMRDTVPDAGGSAVVHGDFRLDNTLIALDAGGTRVAAVLDWEMSTLGDPLTDLGLFGVYWELHGLESARSSPLASAIDPAAGYVPFDAIVEAYAAARGIVVPDLAWYRAMGCFKLAVILEGIHYRYTQGQTVGPGFEDVGAIVPELADWGLRLHEGTD